MNTHLARLLAVPAVLVLAACGSGGGAGNETAAEAGFGDGESVTIVVPTAAGGGFDTEARLLQPALQDKVQQQTGTNVTVRVENAPGGDGRIGAQRVFEASANDNLVWYYFPNTLVGSQLEDGDRAGYDTAKFAPIAVWGNGPSAFVLPEQVDGLSERNIQGLSARSEQKPLLIGGVGLDRELALMKQLLQEQGLPFEYQIVEGSGTSDTASFLLRGDIEVGYSTGAGLRPFVAQEPSLEFMVSTACETDPSIPDVPTIVEAGWPNAETICQSQTVPRAFLGGPEMPQAKADQLTKAFTAVLEDPKFQAKAEAKEHFVQPGGAREARAAIKSKLKLYRKYADDLGF